MKTALRRANLSGTFVVGKYRFSPYMACEHGCLYCDGRAERYWVEGDFERDIVVRSNLPEKLAEEMPKLREKGFVSVGSGISDAYQPIEKRERIMERCARTLADYDHPAVLMTKSALCLRDIDIWARLNERSGFVFLVSLTHSDDSTRAEWEPRASRVAERLDALRRFKEAGCTTGVLAMPLLPRITDTEDNLRRLYDMVAGVGVDLIMPGGLTLRPGRQKDVAMNHLRQNRPNLVSEYEHIYREERMSGSPAADYIEPLYPRFAALNAEYGVPWLVPHRIYRGRLRIYDEVNVLLHHMGELYESRGVPTRSLKSSLKRYMEWLTHRKKEYNRHRSWRYEDLDGELVALCRAGEGTSGTETAHTAASNDPGTIDSLLRNSRLSSFVRAVVLERKVFNYLTLTLT